MKILKRRDQQRLSGDSIFQMPGPYFGRQAFSVSSVNSVAMNKIRENPCNPRLKIAKVANTGCPIAMLILQNKPNFRPFQLKFEDFAKKQTQFKPNQSQFCFKKSVRKPKQTQSCLGEAPRRRIFGFAKINNLVNPVILSEKSAESASKKTLCDLGVLCGYNNSVAKEKMKNDAVVIGLGNTLMADEGIGCVIAGRFLSQQEKYPGVEFIDAGTGGMNLLHIISGRKKAIIIDCAVMGTEPGTIKRFTAEQAKSVKQLSHYSLHEADVLQIIEMSRKLGEYPGAIVIFGIEPASVEQGRELSKALSGRLSEYIKTIEKELSV